MPPTQIKTDAEFGLSSDFWAGFVERHWERSPLVIEKPFPTPLATPAEIFQSLLNASDQYRAGDRSFEPRFHIDHALLRADIGKHIPESNDGSIAAYAERMTRKIEGRQFGLVLNDYQLHDAQFWLRVREFLSGLYQFIGMPAEATEASVFLGNYEKTPFGLHKDTCSMFMFVVEGRKRIRAWPDEYFRGKENVANTLDYEQFLNDAVTLEGDPGDVIYWPSSYWHVGESVGGLSLCLNLVLCVEVEPYAEVLKHAGRLIRARHGVTDNPQSYRFDSNNPQETAGTVPVIMERAANALKEVGHDPELEQALKVAWLNRVTGFGFNIVPPPLPWRKLADDDLVRGDQRYPVAWFPAGEDEIICSANGHAFSITGHPNVPRLLGRLNSGTQCRVSNLTGEYSRSVKVGNVEFEATPEDIRMLLEKLWSLRVITVAR